MPNAEYKISVRNSNKYSVILIMTAAWSGIPCLLISFSWQ